MVSAGPDPIVMPELAFVAVIGGLRGVEEIRFRQWIRTSNDELPVGALRSEPHDPATDEHNFVFSESPAVFPGEGTYEIGIDLQIEQHRATYRYAFAIARDTAKQLSDLNTGKSEPPALDDFAPVVTAVDAWMTAHAGGGPAWEVIGRSNGIVKLVFPAVTPKAKPLTSLEQSPGFMKHASIEAHLDAAIIAAESCTNGNAIIHSDRVILHAKELADLLKNHPRIEGQVEPRIKQLVGLVNKILVNDPWLTRSLNEAIDPIRNVK